MFSRERQVGIQAVLKASSLCQSVFKNLVKDQTLVKADASPVTIADFGAQAVINYLINKEFPLDKIVGEEDAKDLVDNPSLCDKVLELTSKAIPEMQTKEQLLSAVALGSYIGGGKGRFWTLDPMYFAI